VKVYEGKSRGTVMFASIPERLESEVNILFFKVQCVCTFSYCIYFLDWCVFVLFSFFLMLPLIDEYRFIKMVLTVIGVPGPNLEAFYPLPL